MYKNIFVLCTGRCGSTTFSKACAHLTNYSAGHETRTHMLGAARLAYPAFHIEADNRLSWLLGRLDAAYGDNAFYVHLERDRRATVKSYAKRKGGIISAYKGGGILLHCKETDREKLAEDYVDTVTENIRHFLRDKTHKMPFRLEYAQADFNRFVRLVSAEGDLDRARAEFHVPHNAS
ncbi:hypothetical protein [Shimia sp. FJ5]|uniref:hypothetical protein n=1 Tax=Shimia sp. FJ5 TaxID=3079054 RepID=UPI0026147C42|nr:hypothetical protein [Shimia sp. FJ5]MDV4144121.1 hypothetical protein [Shimia sp. FJ5]